MARSRKARQRRSAALVSPWWIGVILSGVIILFIVVLLRVQSRPSPESAATTGTVIEFPHIHGLGFSNDGQQLIVAAHDGTRVWKDGRWQIPVTPAHDYMGYAPTDDGFYSSGHPAPGASLPNPLGLVKSTDGGQTLTSLSAQGERDFHVLGVGYTSHAIYALNPQASGAIAAGIAMSRDDGKTWTQVPVRGLPAAPLTIAVHATDTQVVAFATDTGLWLSTDGGQTVNPLLGTTVTTAATWSVQDGRLWSAGATLQVYDPTSQTQTQVPLPDRAAPGSISALAINPTDPTDIVLATTARTIYRSPDNGQSWTTLVQAGRATAVP